jgi:hypothetical protein
MENRHVGSTYAVDSIRGSEAKIDVLVGNEAGRLRSAKGGRHCDEHV